MGGGGGQGVWKWKHTGKSQVANKVSIETLVQTLCFLREAPSRNRGSVPEVCTALCKCIGD